MSFPNKFAAKCTSCGAKVPEGKGVTSGSRGAWVTHCAACASELPKADAPTIVYVRRAGLNVAIRATGAKMDAAQFTAFRAAVTGARWDADSKTNVLRVDLARPAVAAIVAARITVDIDEDTKALLDAQAHEVKAAVDAAAARTATVEAVLAQDGRSLYPYQREGVAWLAGRNAALLADDMGLGKTIQALTAIPAGAPVIVVCPAVAKSVWQMETARWRTDLRVAVLDGRGALRAPAPGELVVINYDILPVVEAELPPAEEDVGLKGTAATKRAALRAEATATAALFASLPAGTCLVLDEAHAVANSKAARTKRVRALARAARAAGGRVYLLTATPLKNKPPELWNVLECGDLAREAFGSYKRFQSCFNAYQGRFAVEWGQPTAEVPGLLARVMLRRVKSDVLADLPAKTRRELPASIDRATAKLCDEALAELLGPKATQLELGLAVEKAVEVLAKGGSCSFEMMSAARAALAKAKIPAMLALVEEHEASEIPLVVFSAYRAPVDILATREGWATITGETAPEQRGEIVRRFQAGELRGVACTIRAGGVAITLTRASNVLRVDREWNPALNVQAEDRCYRIGQKSAVLVTDLVADHPLDQRIAEVLARKEQLIGASVDAATVQHVEPQTAPAIDWTAVEEQAAQAIREAATLQLAALQGENDRAKRVAERKAAVLRAQAIEKVRGAAAARLSEPESEEDAPRFSPRTELESWALDGLRQLASDDPDRALALNGVGFSKSDGGLGHALAWLGELTAQEWRLAVRMARHYHRQIGTPPGEKSEAA